MVCGQFLNGDSFSVNKRSVLIFIISHQPYIPKFNTVYFLQSSSYIFNYSICSAISIFPFKVYAVVFIRIVLYIIKCQQMIVIICAAIIYCSFVKIYYDRIFLRWCKFCQRYIGSNKFTNTQTVTRLCQIRVFPNILSLMSFQGAERRENLQRSNMVPGDYHASL